MVEPGDFTRSARRLLCMAAIVVVAAWAPASFASGLVDTPSWPGVSTYGPLAELPSGHWAYRSLEELIQAGAIVEYAPGLLDGTRTISRYEAAMLLVDAFRRVGGVKEGGRDRALQALPVTQLTATVKGDPSRRGHLADVVMALASELGQELSVLGYVVTGPDGSPAASPLGFAAVQLSPETTLSLEGAKRTATTGVAKGSPGGSGAPAAGQAVSAAGTVEAGSLSSLNAQGILARGLSSSLRVGLRSSEPGQWDIDGRLDVRDGISQVVELGAIVAGGPGRWVWARAGRVFAPIGSSYAIGDLEVMSLQGVEARFLGADSRTGVMLAQGVPDTGAAAFSDAATNGPAVAVLDGSLALSREIVVGAAVVRGGSSPETLLSTDQGETVTSVVGQYSPVPWLSLKGEYAQNLWALPLFSAAMRLDATLQLGDVTLGARLGTVDPGFRPAVGSVEPGSEVGVDASVRLGDVQVSAGAGRRNPASLEDSSSGQPEYAASVGLRLGSLPGGMVSADYELISVDDLVAGRRPDRSRARLSLDWGADRTRVSMGVVWADSVDQEPAERGSSPAVQAKAAVAYQLNSYATVILGYRLIDFGEGEPDRRASDATAQLSLHF